MLDNLVVGLGNPGSQYRHNRHNVGFMMINRLAKRYGIKTAARRCLSRCGGGFIEGKHCLLAKPMAFMNESGRSVVRLLQSTRLTSREMIVLHDDLDMESGKIRVKRGGGHGGHNGLRSIIDHLGTGGFRRIKVGIGRPPEGVASESWVLQDFNDAEWPIISDALDEALAVIIEMLKETT